MGSGIEITLQPRVVRVGQAHIYLGMCKDEFRTEIRPFLTEVKIGTQGKGFDRVELDLVWEHYKSRNSCPPKRQLSDEPRQDRATVITSSKKSKGTPKPATSSKNAFDTMLSSEKRDSAAPTSPSPQATRPPTWQVIKPVDIHAAFDVYRSGRCCPPCQEDNICLSNNPASV